MGAVHHELVATPAARGQRALARAETQAGVGLAPEVEGVAEGFLAYRFVDGRAAERHDTGLLEAMEGYLAHLAAGPERGAPRFEDILGMTRLNVAEGLGEGTAGRTGWMDGLRERVLARPAIAGDGRMLPQEWLRTGAGVTSQEYLLTGYIVLLIIRTAERLHGRETN